MKKSMMIAIAAAMLTAGTTICHAQTSQSQQTEKKQDSGKIYDVVEQNAEFPGGPEKLREFLRKNLKYPEKAQEDNVTGRVSVRFVVTKKGKVTDVEVVKSVHPALDAEAIRVIKAMPRWTPAKMGRKAVNSRWVLPLTFRLQ